MTALYVALGAAIGAPARFLIDQYLRKFTSRPLGTFTVNIIGSFLLGLTVSNKTHWHDFLAIGFAGAFTTWSAFILDIDKGLAFRRRTALNLVLTFGLSIAAVAAGVALAS